MSNLVSWSFYTLRKKIDPKQWVKSLGIKNYETFKDELKKRGIKVPPLEMVKDLFVETIKQKKEEKEIKTSILELIEDTKYLNETLSKDNIQKKNKK